MPGQHRAATRDSLITQPTGRVKRNVAALARNGWLPPSSAAAPSQARGTRAEFLRRFSGSQAHEASAEEEEGFTPDDEASDIPECADDDYEGADDIFLVPSLEEVKRNLGHLARTGRLPPFNYRRPFMNADVSEATSPWPQARPKRLAKRCRPRGEEKRNVAAMARKGRCRVHERRPTTAPSLRHLCRHLCLSTVFPDVIYARPKRTR
ncbi:hypothetical protein MRX96_028566 [Rhipicephalus microplus]